MLKKPEEDQVGKKYMREESVCKSVPGVGGLGHCVLRDGSFLPRGHYFGRSLRCPGVSEGFLGQLGTVSSFSVLRSALPEGGS